MYQRKAEVGQSAALAVKRIPYPLSQAPRELSLWNLWGSFELGVCGFVCWPFGNDSYLKKKLAAFSEDTYSASFSRQESWPPSSSAPIDKAPIEIRSWSQSNTWDSFYLV